MWIEAGEGEGPRTVQPNKEASPDHFNVGKLRSFDRTHARARGCDIFNEWPSMEKGERSLYHAATFCAISPLRINQKSLMWKGLIMALTGLQHTVHTE